MKHVTLLLAALVLVFGIHSFGRADAPAGVTRWEYRSLHVYGAEVITKGPFIGDSELRTRFDEQDKDKDGFLDDGVKGYDDSLVGLIDPNRDGKVSSEEHVSFWKMPSASIRAAGLEGWELVSAGGFGVSASTHVLMLFKRPLR